MEIGFIYAIIHPETKEIRYIGQTVKSIDYRLKTHINSANISSSNSRKTPIGKWIFKLLSNGLRPEIILLDTVEKDKLNDAEIEHIKTGRVKYRLLNVADGGRIEGRKVGSKQTKEFCENQSIARSGINNQHFVDLTGRKNYKLTVIGLDGFRNKRSWWVCKCECGGTAIVSTSAIRKRKSCGCTKKERWTKEARKKLSEYTKTRKTDSITKQFIAV